MAELLVFVSLYGYWLLFGWVVVDQLGVPIPAAPVLIGAGVLAGTGELDLAPAVAVAAAAALLADLVWYEVGRRRGSAVLQILCRVALEPDSCVRRTEDTFGRYGARSLIVAKLIPGYQTVAAALSGMSLIPLPRFVAFDALGALLWSGLYIGIGFALHDQIERAVQLASDFGFAAGLVVGGSLVGWLAWKVFTRQRFIRSLRINRIEPAELKRWLDEGVATEIVDLRSRMERVASPHSIPGARVMSIEEIDLHHETIPRDAEIVLFCT
jgi:membrane protein DedA with SNARE-associated domain